MSVHCEGKGIVVSVVVCKFTVHIRRPPTRRGLLYRKEGKICNRSVNPKRELRTYGT